MTAFVTPDTMPQWLEEVPQRIEAVGREIADESGGKFGFEMVDPDAADSPLSRQDLYQTYGLQPIAVSLFSPESYYLHLLLQMGDEGQWLFPSGEMSEAEFAQDVERYLAPHRRLFTALLRDLAAAVASNGTDAKPDVTWKQRSFEEDLL